MDGSVLFSRPTQAQEYTAWRDTELRIGNPWFLDALRPDKLQADQRHALYQALEMLRIPRSIGQKTVEAALEDQADLGQEEKYAGGELSAQLMTPVACMVGGAPKRRDEVRRRLLLALRIIRLARSQ